MKKEDIIYNFLFCYNAIIKNEEEKKMLLGDILWDRPCCDAALWRHYDVHKHISPHFIKLRASVVVRSHVSPGFTVQLLPIIIGNIGWFLWRSFNPPTWTRIIYSGGVGCCGLQEEEEDEEEAALFSSPLLMTSDLPPPPCSAQGSYVASRAPGFTATSTRYLEPVSSLMVRLWPKRVPSTLKKTGPSLGWIRSATWMVMIGGTLSMFPGCGSGCWRRGCWEGPAASGRTFHNKSWASPGSTLMTSFPNFSV